MARSKFSFSLEIFNLARDLNFFLIFGPSGSICLTIRSAFASRYFCKSIRVGGRWNTPQLKAESRPKRCLRFLALSLSQVSNSIFCEPGKNRSSLFLSETPQKHDIRLLNKIGKRRHSLKSCQVPSNLLESGLLGFLRCPRKGSTSIREKLKGNN